MKYKMQSNTEDEKQIVHWTKQRMKCVEIHRTISDIPLWKSPIMSVEIERESDEAAKKQPK